MLEDPLVRAEVKVDEPSSPRRRDRAKARWSAAGANLREHIAHDEEKRIESNETLLEVPANQLLDLNHYRLVSEVWHYCSVDPGSKCRSPSSKGEGLPLTVISQTSPWVTTLFIVALSFGKMKLWKRIVMAETRETFRTASDYGLG
jgi:hypothetical protein